MHSSLSPDYTYANLTDGCISPNQHLIVTGSFRDTVHVNSSNIVYAEPNIKTPYLANTSVANGDATWFQYNKYIASFAPWHDFYSVCTDDHNNILAIGTIVDTILFYNGTTLAAALPSLSKTYFAKFDSAGNFLCYQTDSSTLKSGATSGNFLYTVGLLPDTAFGYYGHSSIDLVKWDISSCSQIWRTHMHEVIPGNIEKVNNPPGPGNEMVIYPNPCSSGLFFLKNSATANVVSIDLYNLRGDKIPVASDKPSIDISAFSKGIYLYRIVLKNGTIASGKLIYE